MATSGTYVGAMFHVPCVYLMNLLVLHIASSAYGHGRLTDPPSRSSMWRYGFNSTPNYEDNQLYCGGFQNQWKLNDGKCGVCGDPWQGPRENEAGGKYGRGIITRRYQQNSTVVITVELTATHKGPRENEAGGKYGRGIITRRYQQNSTVVITVELTATHKGWFEFRLCPNNDPSRAVTPACLDQHLLQLADGTGTRYSAIEGQPMKYYIPLRFPPMLVCSQCVLQWKYNTGNSWGVADDGRACVGCGPQEQFYGCADVSIERRNDTASLAASPNPDNGTTTDAVWFRNTTWRPANVTNPSTDGLVSSSSQTELPSWIFAVMASLPVAMTTTDEG
ncbi:hypothetical protein LSAT2_029951 [Lamellibrachia satsuma]|nr:hypothetical protein LSAT2_029951 [Lamellibrachia satsuma]